MTAPLERALIAVVDGLEAELRRVLPEPHAPQLGLETVDDGDQRALARGRHASCSMSFSMRPGGTSA